MSPPVPSTATSLQRRVLRAAALALRILFRLASDAVIYGFLATSWAGGFGGLVLIVFVMRHCGEGSAALQLRAFGLPVFILSTLDASSSVSWPSTGHLPRRSTRARRY
jgi:hypothetical protein